MGAFIVLYPHARILTVVPFVLFRVPAWIWFGIWFLYQLIEANFGLVSTAASGGGVAFFAHVGGFLFGALATGALVKWGRVNTQAE